MLRSERSSLSQRHDVLLSVLTFCFARVLRRRHSAPRQREHHQERCREKHGDLLQRVIPSTFRFLLPITRFAPIHRSHLGHAGPSRRLLPMATEDKGSPFNRTHFTPKRRVLRRGLPGSSRTYRASALSWSLPSLWSERRGR